MTLIRYRGGFPALNNATRIAIALPSLLPAPGEKFPVLWLLGDEGKAFNEYLRRMNIEKISEESGYAIVMPEGLHSDYEDMVRGLRWYQYLSEALPVTLRETFPLSEDPEKNLVFGFGMGGLGAIRLGLRNPTFACRFGACDTDFDVFSTDEAHSSEKYIHKLKAIYGDEFRSQEVLKASDVFHLISSVSALPDLRLYLTSGASAPASASSNKLAEALSCDLPLLTDTEAALKAFLR